MIKGGPRGTLEGLLLYYDTRDPDSYEGEPTTNFIGWAQPRYDNSYSSFVFNNNSSWQSLHPRAKTVYSIDSSNVSNWSNTGANSGNWSVIGHCHYVIDEVLETPVLEMHPAQNEEGEWRAYYPSLGKSYTDMGLTYGDKYTISWLQKADVVNTYAKARLYQSGFKDGQTTSSSTGQLSNELGKWAHKSETFTVSNSNVLTSSVTLFMYGHYTPTHLETIRITDVQVEPKVYSTPISRNASDLTGNYNTVRSKTDILKDISGNSNHGDMSTGMVGTSATHYRYKDSILGAAYLKFDGTSDSSTRCYVSTPIGSGRNVYSDPITIVAWVSPDQTAYANKMWLDVGGNGTNQRLYASLITSSSGNGFGIQSQAWSVSTSGWVTGQWYHQAIVLDRGTARSYADGVHIGTKYYTSYSLPGNFTISTLRSDYNWNGKVSMFQIYERALTTDQIMDNYEATKGRHT